MVLSASIIGDVQIGEKSSIGMAATFEVLQPCSSLSSTICLSQVVSLQQIYTLNAFITWHRLFQACFLTQ